MDAKDFEIWFGNSLIGLISSEVALVSIGRQGQIDVAKIEAWIKEHRRAEQTPVSPLAPMKWVTTDPDLQKAINDGKKIVHALWDGDGPFSAQIVCKAPHQPGAQVLVHYDSFFSRLISVIEHRCTNCEIELERAQTEFECCAPNQKGD